MHDRPNGREEKCTAEAGTITLIILRGDDMHMSAWTLDDHELASLRALGIFESLDSESPGILFGMCIPTDELERAKRIWEGHCASSLQLMFIVIKIFRQVFL